MHTDEKTQTRSKSGLSVFDARVGISYGMPISYAPRHSEEDGGQDWKALLSDRIDRLPCMAVSGWNEERLWNMLRIFGKTGYIFTDKKNPKWGIMSTILGLIATVSISLAVHFTYQNKGTAPMQYGAVVILSMIYAVAGLALGIRSLMEKDIFRIFPVIGILLNALTVIAGGIILYLGVV